MSEKDKNFIDNKSFIPDKTSVTQNVIRLPKKEIYPQYLPPSVELDHLKKSIFLSQYNNISQLKTPKKTIPKDPKKNNSDPGLSLNLNITTDKKEVPLQEFHSIDNTVPNTPTNPLLSDKNNIEKELKSPKEIAILKLKELLDSFLDEVNKKDSPLKGYRGQDALINKIFAEWSNEIKNGRTKPFTEDDIVSFINNAARELPVFSLTRTTIKTIPNKKIKDAVVDTLYNPRLSKIFKELNKLFEK